MKTFFKIFVSLLIAQVVVLAVALLTKVFLPLVVLPYALFWMFFYYPEPIPIFSDEYGMAGWWTEMLMPAIIFSLLIAVPIYVPLRLAKGGRR